VRGSGTTRKVKYVMSGEGGGISRAITINISCWPTVLPPDERNAHDNHDCSIYDTGYRLWGPNAWLVRRCRHNGAEQLAQRQKTN
jgi:hypothetical protein